MQGFVLKALLKREMVTRFGRYKLGLLWMLVDPLVSVIEVQLEGKDGSSNLDFADQIILNRMGKLDLFQPTPVRLCPLAFLTIIPVSMA